MGAFRKDRAAAVSVLAILVLACLLLPAFCLKARSSALQDLSDEQDLLARLEARHHRDVGKANRSDRFTAAPESALLHAQTPGLASAQLETYVSQLAISQQAGLISSAVLNAAHPEDSDAVRIQTTLDIRYDALQRLLYKLESGSPYVFVDAFVLQPEVTGAPRTGTQQAMKVTLNLRALWSQTP